MDFIGIFFRLLFIQVGWNYNSLMSYGFFLALASNLEKLYGKAAMRSVILRYNSYFSTHPYMAPFIAGAALKYEQEAAAGDVRSISVERLRMIMMAPLAALGDSFFWAAVKPAAIMLTVMWLYIAGTPKTALLGIAGLFVLYNVIQISIRFIGLRIGYREGKSFILTLKKLEMQKIVDIIQKSAILFIGAFWGYALVSLIKGSSLIPADEGRRSVLWVVIMSMLAIYVVKKIPNIVIVALFLFILMIGSVL